MKISSDLGASSAQGSKLNRKWNGLDIPLTNDKALSLQVTDCCVCDHPCPGTAYLLNVLATRQTVHGTIQKICQKRVTYNHTTKEAAWIISQCEIIDFNLKFYLKFSSKIS